MSKILDVISTKYTIIEIDGNTYHRYGISSWMQCFGEEVSNVYSFTDRLESEYQKCKLETLPLKIAKPNNDANISGKLHCKKCGYPVVDMCCNEPFNKFQNADSYDWWYYCSNKMCENHDGEGVEQNYPEWIDGFFDKNGNSC